MMQRAPLRPIVALLRVIGRHVPARETFSISTVTTTSNAVDSGADDMTSDPAA
jgi:hypothetical protein